jgi:starch-binding outer membrane protein, SusD/RagB family
MKKINNMKTNIFSVVIAGVIILTGCEELIEKEPIARQSDISFFSTQQGAIQAVNGCYDVLRRMRTFTQEGLYEIGDCMSDDSEVGGAEGKYEHVGAQDASRFAISSSNIMAQQFWHYIYRGIGRCNHVIGRVPEINMDISLRERLVGEAKFLRAFYYFHLNNVFAGVPLVDHPLKQEEFYSVPRSTRIETYNFIVNDLLDAIEHLPTEYSAADIGRATMGAAKTLLAKTYLYMATLKKYNTYIEFNGQTFDQENQVSPPEYFQKSKTLLDELINSGRYALISGNYTKYAGEPYEHQIHAFAWIFTIEGDNSSESIFEIQAMNGHSGTGADYNESNHIPKWQLVRDAIAPDGTPISKPGFGFNCPTQDLFDAFEEEDSIRLHTTITTDNDSILWEYEGEIVWCMCNHAQSPTGYGQGKYRPVPFELFGGGGAYPATQSGHNQVMLRYADVLLMHAEVCMELGLDAEAKSSLKTIRNRVNLTDYPDATKYPGLQDLKEAVYHERRVELALEHNRWFDLVRWGRAEQELAGTKFGEYFEKGKHEYLPIPETQVIISKGSIIQNRGY